MHLVQLLTLREKTMYSFLLNTNEHYYCISIYEMEHPVVEAIGATSYVVVSVPPCTNDGALF